MSARFTTSLASCGRCGHVGHFGPEGEPHRCMDPRCDCLEWIIDECLGSFGKIRKGECPGGKGGRHTPGCPDFELE